MLTRPAALAATLAAAAALAVPAAVPAHAACDPATSVVLTCVQPLVDKYVQRLERVCVPPIDPC